MNKAVEMPGPSFPSATIDVGHDIGAAHPASWIFRLGRKIQWLLNSVFGMISVLVLLAIAANIPIIQFLAFGYLLEISGRLGQRRPFQDSFVGLTKASKLGSVLLGSWLLLWPVRLIAKFRLDAYIIDPSSPQQRFLETAEIVVLILMIAHVFSAIICGGKLRYFFWPIVAPFSLASWILRRFANAPLFRRILRFLTGWISPHLVDDLCRVQPITDWFLPFIVWKKIRSGKLYVEAREGLWAFLSSVRIWHYAQLGFWGFIGSLIWLFLPTVLLINATQDSGGGPVLMGVFGSLLAVPIFSLLPFLQVHYAVDGRIRRFAEIREVLRNVGRAPFSHLVALTLTLTFALPLFLLKVERIPDDLLWTLSLFFVLFALPTRWVCGWAYRRGLQSSGPRRWWIRYPVWLLLLTLSFTFVFFMFFTRYITWNGAWSLIENHVFLIPAPFWFPF